MKFKTKGDARVLKFVDHYEDELAIERYESSGNIYVVINGGDCVALGPKKARKLAEAILMELLGE